jgi:hypothetical protein
LKIAWRKRAWTREEAEKSLEFELMFGSSLMQEYVAKLKASQEKKNKAERSN